MNKSVTMGIDLNMLKTFQQLSPAEIELAEKKVL